MQIFAIVVSLAISLVAIALFVKAIRSMIATIKIGQPAANRSDDKGARWLNMLKETLAHTRMLQWTAVGIGHWFIFVGFGLLFFTLLTAYGQLFDPYFALPVIGTFFLYEWVSELFTVVMVLAILAFIGYRVSRPKERTRGTRGRFYGSTMWQAYFVEAVILGVGLCILTLRGAEYAIAQYGDHPDHATAFHFPFTAWLGGLLGGMSETALASLIFLVAMLKIVISMTWMIVLSQNTTMGVAWHRFTAWFNIWFKRRSDGGTSLGALQPMMAGGVPIDFENIEEMDEDTALGVGKVEDFSWKGILDFTSCTECGRCQSQCPAWNTDKPLSPKLLITNLRDHAYKKAPYLLASSDEERAALPGDVLTEAERPLVGETEGWAWMPEGGAVIDSDVLWSCTSCGACVQQCPVDIEHVDHIVDMRRYQILVESNFPAELNQLFKGLENKGNPWNMSPSSRMEWAKDLPFDVKVVGEDIESLDEVEWLFWVGCAGAYEDRAKKTTRAVAELLDMAEVSFGVLGNGETCTGDPARRAGNEFVFQGLAAQNAETFKERSVKKVVSTCAHCFNTLKNEYSQFGVELEVVHHTQLLNRLVREGRLTPVAPSNGGGRSITYHDPCYLGRHNQVYNPPRELLNVIPNAELKEMPRNSERSFCCGAGGARMWMEEKLGERINLNRTTEAVETGADQIATGCPFCRVMLSDGLTSKQADGSAREEVEVLDVAQLLLASVKGEAGTPVKASAAAKTSATSAAGAATAAAAAGTAATTTVDPEATKAEPEAGDVTQTEDTVTATEDVGPNAKASGSGGSLFDTPADSAAQTEAETKPASGGSLFDTPGGSAAQTEAKPASGGSLFDVGGDSAAAEEATATESKAAAPADGAKPASGGSLFDTPADSTSQAEAETKPASGGSLFDVGGDSAAAEETPAPESKAAAPADEADPAESAPVSSVSSGGSLFDVAPSEPEPAATETTSDGEQDKAESIPSEEAAGQGADAAADAGTTTEATASEPGLGSTGSLFDVAPSEPEPAAQAEAPTEPQGTSQEAAETAAPAADLAADAEADVQDESPAEAGQSDKPTPATGTTPTGTASASNGSSSISSASSLFDIAPSNPEQTAESTAESAGEPATSEATAAPEATAEPEESTEAQASTEAEESAAPDAERAARPEEPAAEAEVSTPDTEKAAQPAAPQAGENGAAPVAREPEDTTQDSTGDSTGEPNEPKPVKGIDEQKSLFDI
ncbi:MAG TPA: heterodisulfide reductase-related iron-sulfur binding cluster [Nocardioidaceae bacterium]|nr:heterodisulfide reductase-related iron-sulfur binding cluster [Nocardioidaceae bacterium]